MSSLKWILAIGLLVVATVATGGLDLGAIAIAIGIYLYFRKVK